MEPIQPANPFQPVQKQITPKEAAKMFKHAELLALAMKIMNDLKKHQHDLKSQQG